ELRLGGQDRATGRFVLGLVARVELADQFLFGAEVVVGVAGRDPGLARDRPHRGGLVAHLPEQPQSRLDDGRPRLPCPRLQPRLGHASQCTARPECVPRRAPGTGRQNVTAPGPGATGLSGGLVRRGGGGAWPDTGSDRVCWRRPSMVKMTMLARWSAPRTRSSTPILENRTPNAGRAPLICPDLLTVSVTKPRLSR